MTRPVACIVDITLDNRSIVTRQTEVEAERHKAISDLLHENAFRLRLPESAAGPYKLLLALDQDRLSMDVRCTVSGHREDLRLPMAGLRQYVQDYAIVCDNFHKTARAGQIHRLEAIDEGRRALHDEAAGALAESLEGKVVLDKMTARRLFTLLYVLHARTVNL